MRLDPICRRDACQILAIGLVILAGLFGIDEVAVADRPDNILLITCDNLGFGDLPCYNAGSSIVAPNLSRLASQGVRLTNFYTASPTCTVSRACLLTGRLPQRHGLDTQLPGVEGNYGVGLNHQESLLPQFLKRGPRPYATGCFGKWNIGFATGSRPTERGFDEFVGHASGNMDYYHHHYRQRHDLYRGTEPLSREGEYSTDLFADAAIEFIQRHSANDKPWFCYLPFNAPHFPSAGNKRLGQPTRWQAPDDAFKAIGLSPHEKNPRKRYEAVVFALDRAIGRVLDALEAAGQDNHTFVFFMSDNGAFRLKRKGIDVGRNDPLRSGGVTCWEGGLRVAAMARWPRRIAADSVIDEPFWSPDLLVACLEIAGVELPIDSMPDDSKPDSRGLVLDGRNPIPLLTNGTASPHRSFFFSYRSHAAVRMGHWKIVRQRSSEAWQLFNLRLDASETVNLAGKEHETLKQLVAEFDSWQEKLAAK